MRVRFSKRCWSFISPFRLAGEVWSDAWTVVVELMDGALKGRGEARGVYYRAETADSMLAQLAAVESQLVNGVSREELQALLPAGGARNAIDCALWDLEAKRAGKRVWELAGMRQVTALRTAYTLSMDTPEAMGRAAASAQCYSLLKAKLDGGDDLARIIAVRRARPDAEIVVDANQAWNEEQLHQLIPQFSELGVKLIEQPVPPDEDEVLRGFVSSIPLCADEACQTTESLYSLVRKYQYVNIKLDKAGGLTEALRIASVARDLKFKLMVGCMGGSSLSMAPGFVVGQLCDVVDLDGPLLCTRDVPHGIRYEGSRMGSPDPLLWG